MLSCISQGTLTATLKFKQRQREGLTTADACKSKPCMLRHRALGSSWSSACQQLDKNIEKRLRLAAVMMSHMTHQHMHPGDD